jgi:hypothetical protein
MRVVTHLDEFEPAWPINNGYQQRNRREARTLRRGATSLTAASFAGEQVERPSILHSRVTASLLPY